MLTHQALIELLNFKPKKVVREQQHENVLEMQITKISEEESSPEEIEFHEYVASEEEGQEAEMPLGEQ